MAKRKWTPEDYGKVSHVGISIFGDAGSDLDAQLAKFGVTRRMALVTPHFIAALAAVSQTDMATTQSRVFASRFAETFGLILKSRLIPNTGLDLTGVEPCARRGPGSRLAAEGDWRSGEGDHGYRRPAGFPSR